MVSGIGFDLVDLTDFDRTLRRSGERFLNRVFTAAEIDYCRSQPHPSQSFAVRFAAKEAAMKALGIAGEEGLSWREFEVVPRKNGAPELVLHGEALRKCSKQRLRWHISLSHSSGAAGAVAVAEVKLPKSQVRQQASIGPGKHPTR